MNGPNKLTTPSGFARIFAAVAAAASMRQSWGNEAAPFRFTEHRRSGSKSKLRPNVWHNKKVRRRMAKVSRLINGRK